MKVFGSSYIFVKLCSVVCGSQEREHGFNFKVLFQSKTLYDLVVLKGKMSFSIEMSTTSDK